MKERSLEIFNLDTGLHASWTRRAGIQVEIETYSSGPDASFSLTPEQAAKLGFALLDWADRAQGGP